MFPFSLISLNMHGFSDTLWKIPQALKFSEGLKKVSLSGSVTSSSSSDRDCFFRLAGALPDLKDIGVNQDSSYQTVLEILDYVWRDIPDSDVADLAVWSKEIEKAKTSYLLLRSLSSSRREFENCRDELILFNNHIRFLLINILPKEIRIAYAEIAEKTMDYPKKKSAMLKFIADQQKTLEKRGVTNEFSPRTRR